MLSLPLPREREIRFRVDAEHLHHCIHRRHHTYRVPPIGAFVAARRENRRRLARVSIVGVGIAGVGRLARAAATAVVGGGLDESDISGGK